MLARQVTPAADKSSVMKDGHLYLLALRDRDDKNLYVEVINRSDKAFTDKVTIAGQRRRATPRSSRWPTA